MPLIIYNVTLSPLMTFYLDNMLSSYEKYINRYGFILALIATNARLRYNIRIEIHIVQFLENDSLRRFYTQYTSLRLDIH